MVRFSWDTPTRTGTTTPNISNYVLVSGTLLRRHCESGVLTVDTVLASNVASATVSCSANADCSGAPTSITVTIVETLDTNHDRVALHLQPHGRVPAAERRRRAGTADCTVGAGHSPRRPVQLRHRRRVAHRRRDHDGQRRMYLNTVDNGGCNALNLSNGAAYTADGTSILNGGSCVASGGLSCPPLTYYSPAFTDPYAGLTPPPTTGHRAERLRDDRATGRLRRDAVDPGRQHLHARVGRLHPAERVGRRQRRDPEDRARAACSSTSPVARSRSTGGANVSLAAVDNGAVGEHGRVAGRRRHVEHQLFQRRHDRREWGPVRARRAVEHLRRLSGSAHHRGRRAHDLSLERCRCRVRGAALDRRVGRSRRRPGR